METPTLSQAAEPAVPFSLESYARSGDQVETNNGRPMTVSVSQGKEILSEGIRSAKDLESAMIRAGLSDEMRQRIHAVVMEEHNAPKFEFARTSPYIVAVSYADTDPRSLEAKQVQPSEVVPNSLGGFGMR